MIEQLLRIPQRWFGLAPSRGRKVYITFLYFYLTIAAYYLIKPVSRSLVLDGMGAALVPYIDLISVVLIIPVALGLSRFAQRTSKTSVVSSILFSCALVMVIGWWALTKKLPQADAAFYVWVSVFSVLNVTVFWLVANDLYRPREAKRLFGFIGAGGILGALSGAYISAILAPMVGSEQLLLLSAATLTGCGLLVYRLREHTEKHTADLVPYVTEKKVDSLWAHLTKLIGTFRRCRYIALLAGLICLGKFVSTLIYYQSNFFIEQFIPGVDAKTSFLGVVLGSVNILALLIQLVFTSYVLRRWGASFALQAWPAVLGVFAGLMLFGSSFFGLIIFMEVFDRSFTYSLLNSAKEILYLPLQREMRYQIKPAIDMVLFRVGKAAAALTGIFLFHSATAALTLVAALILPLLAAWSWLAVKVQRDYMRSVRLILHAYSIPESEEPYPSPHLKSWIHPQFGTQYGRLLQPLCSEPKLLLLIEGLKSYKDSSFANAFIAELMQQECSDAAVQGAGSDEAIHSTLWARLGSNRLADSAELKSLDALPVNGHRSELMALMRRHPDIRIRHAVVSRLLRERVESEANRLERSQLKWQLRTEAEVCDLLMRLKELCRHCCPDRAWLLKLIEELHLDSVKHTFRLLMLRYRVEDLHLIYHQLIEGNSRVRLDALELLENLIDARMRVETEHIIGHYFDPPEQSFYKHSSEIEAELRELIDHPNIWLCITGILLSIEVGNEALIGELRSIGSRALPIVSNAAQFALECHERSLASSAVG